MALYFRTCTVCHIHKCSDILYMYSMSLHLCVTYCTCKVCHIHKCSEFINSQMVLTFTICICGGTSVAQSVNMQKELWLCFRIEPNICKRVKSYATALVNGTKGTKG